MLDVFTYFDFKVPLQNVLNHNIARILEDPDVVEHIERLAEENDGNLEIQNFVKIGFDGTDLGDKDKTKHPLRENSEREEGKLLASSLVNLNMVAFDKDDQCHIIFSNKYLNSSISIRPLRYLFKRVRMYKGIRYTKAKQKFFGIMDFFLENWGSHLNGFFLS